MQIGGQTNPQEGESGEVKAQGKGFGRSHRSHGYIHTGLAKKSPSNSGSCQEFAWESKSKGLGSGVYAIVVCGQRQYLTGGYICGLITSGQAWWALK